MDTNQSAFQKKKPEPSATQAAKGSPHQTLLRLGKEGNKFFSNPNGEPYVCLNFEQSSKAMKIKHKNFKGLLTKLFFEETDEAPTSDALNQALNQFDAIPHIQEVCIPSSFVSVNTTVTSTMILAETVRTPSWKSARRAGN